MQDVRKLELTRSVLPENTVLVRRSKLEALFHIIPDDQRVAYTSDRVQGFCPTKAFDRHGGQGGSDPLEQPSLSVCAPAEVIENNRLHLCARRWLPGAHRDLASDSGDSCRSPSSGPETSTSQELPFGPDSRKSSRCSGRWLPRAYTSKQFGCPLASQRTLPQSHSWPGTWIVGPSIGGRSQPSTASGAR